MRVYLPATVPLLREWLSSGSARPVGLAYAVTPSLREWYREGDLEQLEHAAALAAATASLRLLTDDRAAERRRVVLAVDVDDAAAAPDASQRAAVVLRGEIPRTTWASALIDDVSAEPVVATAAAMLGDATADPGDVEFAVGEAEDVDLGWYAVQELDHVLA